MKGATGLRTSTSRTASGTNVAVTDRAASRVTVQVGVVPLHAPDHPVKKLPPPGMAVSCTVVPRRKDSVQSAPQLMPAGLLLTNPAVPPASWTVRSSRAVARQLNDTAPAGPYDTSITPSSGSPARQVSPSRSSKDDTASPAGPCGPAGPAGPAGPGSPCGPGSPWAP